MRKAKFLPLITVIAFFLASCGDFLNLFEDELATLKEGEFYAQNVKTGNYYKVKAEILADGEKCVVWAEKGSGVTQAKAKEIADEYDNIIRPKIAGAFGKTNFYTDIYGREYKEGSTGQKFFFDDILDYANELAGGRDNKLTILLLDIKDGFDEIKNPSYVAGYFYGGNFYTKGKISGYEAYSNGRDMIYIDTYPGLREDKIHQTYSTLAHELQHLINFVTTVLVERKGSGTQLTPMDTWIDEGLSAWAEFLYEGDNLFDKCEWFIKDGAGTIAKGNNFFVWDNHKDVPMAILDEYATVYLFFRWLYLQAEAENRHQDIFYKIITSPDFNHDAVTGVAKEIKTGWGNWENLLGAWLAANYNPKNTNYGYKGDPYLMAMRDETPVKTLTVSSIPLYPGEGVYSSLDNLSFRPDAGGTNIRYAELLSANTSNVIISGHSQSYTGNTLLTFNSGTTYNVRNPAGSRETGQLTGLSSVLPRSVTGETKTFEFKGPYVLDARDVLGRNRDKNLFLSPGLSGR